MKRNGILNRRVHVRVRELFREYSRTVDGENRLVRERREVSTMLVPRWMIAEFGLREAVIRHRCRWNGESSFYLSAKELGKEG